MKEQQEIIDELKKEIKEKDEVIKKKELQIKTLLAEPEDLKGIHNIRKLIHELSSPFTGILGTAELLLATVEKDNPIRSDIEEIDFAANRCKKIIEKYSEECKK